MQEFGCDSGGEAHRTRPVGEAHRTRPVGEAGRRGPSYEAGRRWLGHECRRPIVPPAPSQCTDVYGHIWTEVETCAETCVQMCTDMCQINTNMRVYGAVYMHLHGVGHDPACVQIKHLCRNVHRHVHRNVHRHVRRHVCRDVCALSKLPKPCRQGPWTSPRSAKGH